MNEKFNHEKIRSFRMLSKQYLDTSFLMHEAIARKAGLSGTEHKYLGLLIQQGAMAAGEFSKLTGLTTGAITGLVDRLEKKKLVKRQFDKNDRRKVIIVPDMQNVVKLLQPIFSELNKKNDMLVASFSEGELQVLERYFRSAIQIMDKITKDMNEDNG